jgi:excisionase family DNA binding protein
MSHPETVFEPEAASERLYSVIQAADLLSCSKPHVYRLIATGELPAIDIATPGAGMSKTRIRESDLHAYFARATLP